MAVVAALFAGMEASLITLAKTPEPDGHAPLRFAQPAYQNTVLGLAYVALALNVGCILSALKCIDVLGRMTYWNALKGTVPDPDWSLSGETGLMGSFGVKGRTRLLMGHCFYCLFFGSLCVLAQIIMYVWLHEAMPVVWATLIGVLIAAIPMLLMVW
ncbi:hypothetical protein M407DRAFT_136009 [Tulasnella calospora MUT 4182]|uniref:Uncharacterized protein n=1 Tax=Tulasnella calospora MUT 4182 TaxID=1051891 RepID=A0A0C3QT89_9AGAM|nr:hypothetical protein M407DRAFT_136009 [Tulasnella calospora MUT 4182]